MDRGTGDDDAFGAFSPEAAAVVEKRGASLDERERREVMKAVVGSEKGELVKSLEGQTGEASAEATISKRGDNDEVEKQALSDGGWLCSDATGECTTSLLKLDTLSVLSPLWCRTYFLVTQDCRVWCDAKQITAQDVT